MDDVSFVKLIEAKSFNDFRGTIDILLERSKLAEYDINFNIRQINQGHSYRANTLRGLHFQLPPYEQAKLVWCAYGSIYSVAVDIRPQSPTFGKYVAEQLTSENHKLMYIPKGFAHGYLTLVDNTLMQWCVDSAFNETAAKALLFNDVAINIPWPDKCEEFIISDKDKNALSFSQVKALMNFDK